MSRDQSLRLLDVVESCDAIGSYIAGLDQAGFGQDKKTFDAVVRRFEIIGEAVKGLSSTLIASEPSIPWRQIAGFRDVLSHAYFAVDVSIVWDAATNKIPDLRSACIRLMQRQAPDEAPG